MAFDPKKPVTTRDGRPARIICMDKKHLPGGDSIVALVPELGSPEVERALTYQSNGQFDKSRESGSDLINISVKKWRWIYKNLNGNITVTNHHYESSAELIRQWPNYVAEIIGRLLESEKVDHAT